MLLAISIAIAVSQPATAPKVEVLCGEHTAFTLARDESVVEIFLGIHIGSARIATPDGELVIREGDAWAPPKGLGRKVALPTRVKVVKSRLPGENELGYAVFGRFDYTVFGDQKDTWPDERLLIWVSGSALDGSSRDREVLRRFQTFPFDKSICTERMNYGWDAILGPPKK